MGPKLISEWLKGEKATAYGLFQPLRGPGRSISSSSPRLFRRLMLLPACPRVPQKRPEAVLNMGPKERRKNFGRNLSKICREDPHRLSFTPLQWLCGAIEWVRQAARDGAHLGPQSCFLEVSHQPLDDLHVLLP